MDALAKGDSVPRSSSIGGQSIVGKYLGISSCLPAPISLWASWPVPKIHAIDRAGMESSANLLQGIPPLGLFAFNLRVYFRTY
jgi:hypothetical protein